MVVVILSLTKQDFEILYTMLFKKKKLEASLCSKKAESLWCQIWPLEGADSQRPSPSLDPEILPL